MAGSMSFTMIDNSNERTTIQFNTPDLNSGNIDDTVNDGIGGDLGDMRLALSALSLANHEKRSVVAVRVIEPNADAPADPNAQRERVAVVTYRDTVTGRYETRSIPAFNMVGVVTGTDVIDTSGVQWQAFITVLEANHVSNIGNPIQFISARHAGRSS